MSARPILFSGPMVRALLEGRKTQTRRVVKGPALDLLNSGIMPAEFEAPELRLCPYGVPGDLLWVRESWRLHERFSDVARIVYAASERRSWTEAHEDFPVELSARLKAKPGFRPSIHMPRWASRLTLRVTEARVERLRDISEDDALAEGIKDWGDGFHWEPNPVPSEARLIGLTAKRAYFGLWEEINGRDSLDANPWVWALSFEVLKQNVDAVIAAREAAHG